jgi:hypothetical protein
VRSVVLSGSAPTIARTADLGKAAVSAGAIQVGNVFFGVVADSCVLKYELEGFQ